MMVSCAGGFDQVVEWDVLERAACTIRLLPIRKPSAGFYDFDEYERLVAAAKVNDRDAYLVVLLGGEGGSDAAMRVQSKTLQQAAIARDQSLFLGSRPALQLPLALARCSARGVIFGIHQSYGPSLRGEGAGAAVVMLHESWREVARLANVQRAIGALEDLDGSHGLTTMPSSSGMGQ
jgi:hypothetical protein